MKDKSLIKNCMYNIVYTIANIIFPFFTSVYVARILLSDGVGRVFYAQNIVSYFVIFATLGLPIYGIREISKLRKKRELLNKTFSELFLINIITTSFSILAYILLIFFSKIAKDDILLFYICGIQIFFNYFNVDWFYQGLEEFGYITTRSLLIKIISLIALFLFVKNREDYFFYALINVLATGGNYIFNIIHLKKYINFNFNEITIKKLKIHIAPLIVLAISIFFSTIYSQVDITMLGSITTEKEVAFYSYAHKIPEMIIMLSTSLTGVFLPRLSYYYKENRLKFNELVENGIKILSFISIPATFAFYVLIPQIIEVFFGSEFLPAVTTARVFSILIIIKSFGNLLCYQLIICSGNEKKRLPAYIVAGISNILLNTILIPIYGAVGAAIASLIAEILVNGIQIFSIRKEFDFKISYKSFIEAIVSSIIMLYGIYYINYIENILIIKFILNVLCGFLIYCITNILMKNEIIIQFFYILYKKYKLKKY